MTNLSKLRQVKPLKFPDILPSSVLSTDSLPEFIWINPQDLFVEEIYQRNVTDRSLKLIKKIYENFQWGRFKPPVCSWGPDSKLFVIDGQHTAIAAASHPKIKKIPVMIIDANTIQERAASFMGHNKDRLSVTPAQLFYSSLIAEDPIALKIKKALDDTGCVMMKYQPIVWVEGHTMAAGALRDLAENKGLPDLTRILTILINAKRAPITALEIHTVSSLLWGKEWKGKFTDEDLTKIIGQKSAEQWKATAEATVRKGQVMPMRLALAIAWYRKVPKKRLTKAKK